MHNNWATTPETIDGRTRYYRHTDTQQEQLRQAHSFMVGRRSEPHTAALNMEEKTIGGVVVLRSCSCLPPRRPSLVVLLLLLLLLTLFSCGATAQQNGSDYTTTATAMDCAALSKTYYFSIESSDDATQLRLDLLRCPGARFEVEWQGTIGLSQTLKLANGTSLRITAGARGNSSAAATIDGGGSMRLFEVNESALHLEGIALTGGSGVEGGAVAARFGSLVEFVDCDVSKNKASSAGGAR